MGYKDDAINALTRASQDFTTTTSSLSTMQTSLSAMVSALGDAQAAVNMAVSAISNIPSFGLVDCMTLAVPLPNKSCRWTTPKNLPASDGRVAIYFPKSVGGFPYDIKIMDANGLREHSTENDKLSWTDPAAASSWKSYDVALYFLPRVYDPSRGEIILSDLTDLPWTRWWTCNTHDPQSHLGPCRTTFVGPLTDRKWGGDVANSPYFVTHYYYKGNVTTGFTVRENFYWAAPFGWFGWECQDGSSLTNTWTTRPNYSIHNTIIPTNVAPVDPCGIYAKTFF